MTQFLNNIWVALSSENLELVNLFMIPATVIEHCLFMNIFLIIFNVNTSFKQKILYVSLISLISIFSLNFILSPFNVIINYTCFIILVHFIF